MITFYFSWILKLIVRQPIACLNYLWELSIQNKFKTFHWYGCETASDYENSSIGNLRSKEASFTDSWKLKVHVVCSHGENANSRIHDFKIVFCQLKGPGLHFHSLNKLNSAVDLKTVEGKWPFLPFVLASLSQWEKPKKRERTQFNYNCW